jgi:hypothetical protein
MTGIKTTAFKDLELAALDVLGWNLNVTTEFWAYWIISFCTHPTFINDPRYGTFHGLIGNSWRDIQTMFGKITPFARSNYCYPKFDAKKTNRFKNLLLKGIHVPVKQCIPLKALPMAQCNFDIPTDPAKVTFYIHSRLADAISRSLSRLFTESIHDGFVALFRSVPIQTVIFGPRDIKLLLQLTSCYPSLISHL